MATDSWLGKIKGALLEDEPEKPGAQQPAQAPVPTHAIRGGGQQPSSPLTYAPMAPQLNQAFVDAIRKQTFQRNTALTALINAADQLVDIIPDPVMRIKAAHKTAGAGRKPQEIADAVAIHLNDVDGEVMRFNQTLQTKITQEVGGLTKGADAAENSVTTAQGEIQRLSERIQQLQQQVGEKTAEAQRLRGEAQSKENDLRQAETEYKTAADAVRQELNTHKSTILSILG